MAFLLENIKLNSPKEFEKLKQKHPFIKSIEKQMEKQFIKSKVKQIFVPQK